MGYSLTKRLPSCVVDTKLLKEIEEYIKQKVGKFHLHRYLSEFDFRFNNRKLKDGERTLEAIKGIEGKRLMYKTLLKPPKTIDMERRCR